VAWKKGSTSFANGQTTNYKKHAQESITESMFAL